MISVPQDVTALTTSQLVVAVELRDVLQSAHFRVQDLQISVSHSTRFHLGVESGT